MLKFVRIIVLSAGALFALAAVAQPAPYDDGPNGSDQADPPSRVGRLAYIDGGVSFVPAGENDWVEAQLNRPLITGDKLWTDRDSRAEITLGTAAVRIDEETSFDFLNLDDNNAQIELTQGSLNLDVRRLYDNQVYEIDTPTLAFVINRVGEYRLTVEPDGRATVVSVLRGGGDVYGEDNARFAVEEGQSVTFNDPSLRDYYTDSLPEPDAFDDFCSERDARWNRSRSREYVAEDVIGYDDLDGNGDWEDVPEYGNVWYPTTVAVGWAPYRYGHWAWVGAYGWTWIDDAAWGFAPFHYGRWVHVRNRWGWCPGPRHVRAYYAPALVAFIGGGVSVGVSIGGPVGWFPLGPRDVYFPGYRVSRRYFRELNVTNTVVNVNVVNNYYGNYSRGRVNYSDIRFANRNIAGAVTAVPAAAFVGARPVARAAIAVNRATFRDARIHAYAALAPTRASLVSARAQTARRPPGAVLDRRIVAASRPPPRVASFAERERMLRKNPGRPLDRAELRALPQARAAGGSAREKGFTRRDNVRVVTNTGVPARRAAAPLIARPANAEARARRAGANRQGGNAASRNASNRNRVDGRGAETRGERPTGRPPANANRNEGLPSSRFINGNRRATENGNGAANRAIRPEQRGGNQGNRASGREQQDVRGARTGPAPQAQGNGADRRNGSGRRDQQMQRDRQEQMQQQRDRQGQMQQQREQQARQAQMQQQREQQARQAQMQQHREQQARQAQMQQQREQQARQAQMQQQREQQARQAQMQQQREQQARQAQMQQQREQQARQAQMQQQREQQARQAQMERQRAQQAQQAQMQRQREQQARQAQMQQQQMRQRQQPQRGSQEQQRGNQQNRSNHGNNRHNKDDDKKGGGGGH